MVLPFTMLFPSSATSNRRVLHQPLFSNSANQPISSSPTPQPQPELQPEPNYPFYNPSQNPFFPSYPPPPPPPPPTTLDTTNTVTSAPANVSSLVIPSSTSHSSHKTILLIFSLAFFSFLILASLLLFLIKTRRRRRPLNADKIRLFHPNNNDNNHSTHNNDNNSIHTSIKIQPNFPRLGSPELHPLPPLPRHHSQFPTTTPTTNNNNDNNNNNNNNNNNRYSNGDEDLKFSTAAVENTTKSTTHFDNSSGSCSPSVVMNFGSQRTTEFSSPDYFPTSFTTTTTVPAPRELNFWKEEDECQGPPELVGPTRKVRKGSFGNSGEIGKPPMFKPALHQWDKIRAGSETTMAWDNFKSPTFMLNEEMIKTLFIVNTSNKNAKDGLRGEFNKGNEMLDSKNSPNIDILLRALNVTIEEVCEALAEGNGDTLGPELLESLLKMAPPKEEEWKLKEFKDDSPFKLGTAETFLKALADIPFAFQRVEAMLYIAKFDSEIEYLKKSFSTLESACKELKSSKMFLKLLEAVLRTGSRVSVGTNHGKANACKLDNLLKLVDIKSTDGKTTLLHFVVQDIIKTEGAHLSGVDQNSAAEESQQATLQDEVDFRKLGLQVVSRLSGELTNVKKAATMHRDLISEEILKLAKGLSKISEVINLNEDLSVKDKNVKFADLMSQFLIKAKVEIANIQAEEGRALSMVKGLTEYFHGDLGKEEACPFRLFVVVRDFLCVLDRVCKDVSKINERTMVSSRKQIPANPVVCEVFPGLSERQQDSSTDDESSLSY